MSHVCDTFYGTRHRTNTLASLPATTVHFVLRACTPPHPITVRDFASVGNHNANIVDAERSYLNVIRDTCSSCVTSRISKSNAGGLNQIAKTSAVIFSRTISPTAITVGARWPRTCPHWQLGTAVLATQADVTEVPKRSDSRFPDFWLTARAHFYPTQIGLDQAMWLLCWRTRT